MSYASDIATIMLDVSCTFCGKPLRDPVSIERGYGPDCDAKYMSGEGAAMVGARMNAVDLEEFKAAILMAPNVKPENWVNPTSIASKGQTLPDGAIAKGGEILSGTTLNMPGLRDYLIGHAAPQDDFEEPDAEWRTVPEIRRKVVSTGVWYASRAVSFGFSGEQVSAEKVDPKHMVVAAVQRVARAAGLHSAADRMANFYAARILKDVRARYKAAESPSRDTIIFETLEGGHLRVHCPYSDTFNRLARESRLFTGYEKDPPYFWRVFKAENLRDVVNLLQNEYGSRQSITRKSMSQQERRQRSYMQGVVDTWTGEVRLFNSDQARKLLEHDRFQPLEKPKAKRR